MEDYARFIFFDRDSPVNSSALSGQPKVLVSDSKRVETVNRTLNASYTIDLLQIMADPSPNASTRDITVKSAANLPSGVKVELWRAASASALRPATFVDSLFGSTKASKTIALAKGERLFAMLINNSSSNQSVSLSVGESSVPVSVSVNPAGKWICDGSLSCLCQSMAEALNLSDPAGRNASKYGFQAEPGQTMNVSVTVSGCFESSTRSNLTIQGTVIVPATNTAPSYVLQVNTDNNSLSLIEQK